MGTHIKFCVCLKLKGLWADAQLTVKVLWAEAQLTVNE